MKNIARFFFIPLLIIFISCDAHKLLQNSIITGRTVNVADGDTITVLDKNNEKHRIRLYGIDAPEKKQAFGKKSRNHLSHLTSGKQVTVRVIDIDRYDRLVGLVFVGTEGGPNQSANAAMIKRGLAWVYPQYCKADFCPDWEKYEAEAKQKRLGLWADKDLVEPWVFRRGI